MKVWLQSFDGGETFDRFLCHLTKEDARNISVYSDFLIKEVKVSSVVYEVMVTFGTVAESAESFALFSKKSDADEERGRLDLMGKYADVFVYLRPVF